MMQSWVVERMAEQRRRDLSALSQPGRGVRAGRSLPTAVPQPRLQAQPVRSVQLVVAGARPVHHPLGQHVGSLLIRAGTRLGGASIRTS
jgi:hypothetical protein